MQKSEKTSAQSTKAKDPKANVRHRVVEARMPRELGSACHCLIRHARDLRNTCIYLGQTALDCFGWDPKSKKSVLKGQADIAKDGQAALAAFNAAILAQNSKRKAKHRAKAKLLPLLDSKCEKLFSVLFDAMLFEGCGRSWLDGLDPLGRSTYSRLPSWLTNHAVQKARGEFSTWLAQLRALACMDRLESQVEALAPQAKPKNHASFFGGESIGAPNVFQRGDPSGQPHFECVTPFA